MMHLSCTLFSVVAVVLIFSRRRRIRRTERMDKAKDDEKSLKKEFDDEANASENSKIKGQPVRAKIEDIMREMGVDRGEYCGRKLEGPGCQKMMAKRDEYHEKLSDYIVSTDEE